jgi:drug/metabolite transporter (DMT)-like permease
MRSSWMLVAGLLFAVMGTLVKLGAKQFSALELVFYRSLFALIVIATAVMVRKASLSTPNLRLHLSRSLCGIVAMTCYFYAMTQLPIATAITLSNTSSLFLALITLLWFRERPQARLILAVMLGFLGVIFLLRPTLNASQLPAGLLGLAAGLFSAIAFLNTKRLSNADEPDWRVVFYFSLFSTMITGLILSFHEFHSIDFQGGFVLLGIGASATLAQLTMTRAYRLGNTLVVGSFAYSAIVFATLMGFVFFDELLAVSSWVGMTIVMVAGLIAIYQSASARGRQENTPAK